MKKSILLLLLLVTSLVACTNETASTSTANSENTAEPDNTAAIATVTEMPEPTATATEVVPTATVPPTEIPTMTPEPEPTATATPSEPVVDPKVRIEGIDSVTIFATFFPGSGPAPWPAVMLLHMGGSNNRLSWEENGMVEELVSNGYAVLTVDMRGHGDTGGAANWSKSRGDLLRSWNYLTEREDVDAARTAVLGASVGSNMALVVGARKPEIRTVIMLSGGFDFPEGQPLEFVTEYGERPLLLVASENDADLADRNRELAEQATGLTELIIYEEAGHGTAMFYAEPELFTIIIDWLNEYVKLAQ